MEQTTLTWDRSKNIALFDACVTYSNKSHINAGAIKLHKKLSNEEKSTLVDVIIDNYVYVHTNSSSETDKVFYTFYNLLKKIRSVKKLGIALPVEFKEDLKKVGTTSDDVKHLECYLRVGEQLYTYVTGFLGDAIRRDNYARKNMVDLVRGCRWVVEMCGISLDDLEKLQVQKFTLDNEFWKKLGQERNENYSMHHVDIAAWVAVGRIET